MPMPPCEAPVSQPNASSATPIALNAASWLQSRCGCCPWCGCRGVIIHNTAYATAPTPWITVSSTNISLITTGSSLSWDASPWATPPSRRPSMGRIIRR